MSTTFNDRSPKPTLGIPCTVRAKDLEPRDTVLVPQVVPVDGGVWNEATVLDVTACGDDIDVRTTAGEFTTSRSNEVFSIR